MGLRTPEYVLSLPSANHVVTPPSTWAPLGRPSVAMLPSEMYLKDQRPTIGATCLSSSSQTCTNPALMKRPHPYPDSGVPGLVVEGNLMPGTSRQPAFAW